MERILAKEEFENFIKFAFESLKNNDFPASYSRKKIKNLFVNPNLQVRSRRKSKVKVGTRNVFIDFPREIFNIMYHLYEVCNEESTDLPKNARDEEEPVEYKRFVELIKSEKNNPEKKIGKLSEPILDMGIKWNVDFKPSSRKPIIIKYEVEGYYRNLWKNKVLQFIEELQKGGDSLVSLYKKIQALTVKYSRLETGKGIRIPHIINLILGENDYLSIEKELEKLGKLFMKIEKYAKKNWGDHPAYLIFEPLLMDIKIIIYQIRYCLKSGYCFTSFLLLRKLMVNWGLFFFQDSLQYYQRKKEGKMLLLVEEREDFYWKWLEKWISSFKEGHGGWNKSFPFANYVIVLDSSKKMNRETTKITDIVKFKNIVNKKGDDYCFNVNLDSRDKFLVEQLDVIINYKMDIWSFAKSGMKVPEDKKFYKNYKEYQNLCEIVHEPIYIDYSPFNSFLEYLAFLYHIRKVLYSLEDAFNCYKRLHKSRMNCFENRQ